MKKRWVLISEWHFRDGQVMEGDTYEPFWFKCNAVAERNRLAKIAGLFGTLVKFFVYDSKKERWLDLP